MLAVQVDMVLGRCASARRNCEPRTLASSSGLGARSHLSATLLLYTAACPLRPRRPSPVRGFFTELWTKCTRSLRRTIRSPFPPIVWPMYTDSTFGMEWGVLKMTKINTPQMQTFNLWTNASGAGFGTPVCRTESGSH